VTRIRSLAVAARERGWGRPGQPLATCRQIVAKLRSIDSTHARATLAADSTRRLQERASVSGARFSRPCTRTDASTPTEASSSPLRKPRIARPVGTHVAAPPYESATVKYLGFEYDICRGALRHFNEASYSLVSRPLGPSRTTWSDYKTITEVVPRVLLARENESARTSAITGPAPAPGPANTGYPVVLLYGNGAPPERRSGRPIDPWCRQERQSAVYLN